MIEQLELKVSDIERPRNMSIVGKHINIYEYPDDQITSNNVIISWEFTHPDVQVDFYLEGIDRFIQKNFLKKNLLLLN